MLNFEKKIRRQKVNLCNFNNFLLQLVLNLCQDGNHWASYCQPDLWPFILLTFGHYRPHALLVVLICSRSFPSVQIPQGSHGWQVICSRCQHEASCNLLTAHALHNLFPGRCLNISCDCVEVWCVPSAMCTYSLWHQSVTKCFETFQHIFTSHSALFHRLGVTCLCLYISLLMF